MPGAWWTWLHKVLIQGAYMQPAELEACFHRLYKVLSNAAWKVTRLFWLFLLVYWLYAFLCTRVYVYQCVCVCRGGSYVCTQSWRLDKEVTYLFPLRQDLSLNLNLDSLSRFPGQWAPRIFLSLPTLLTDMCSYTSAFTWVPEIRTEIPMPVQQTP